MTPELWFSVLAVLQLGDAYTTLRALKRGAVEANPVIKRPMDAIGVKEALLLAKIAEQTQAKTTAWVQAALWSRTLRP